MKYNNEYTESSQARKRVKYLKEQGYELWDYYQNKKEAEELTNSISNTAFTEVVYNPTSGAYLVYWKKKSTFNSHKMDILPKDVPIDMAPDIPMLPAQRNEILDMPAFVTPKTEIAPDIPIFPQ